MLWPWTCQIVWVVISPQGPQSVPWTSCLWHTRCKRTKIDLEWMDWNQSSGKLWVFKAICQLSKKPRSQTRSFVILAESACQKVSRVSGDMFGKPCFTTLFKTASEFLQTFVQFMQRLFVLCRWHEPVWVSSALHFLSKEFIRCDVRSCVSIWIHMKGFYTFHTTTTARQNV